MKSMGMAKFWGVKSGYSPFHIFIGIENEDQQNKTKEACVGGPHALSL